DRDVTVTLPDLAAYKNHTAVIIDDVIASGHTILRALLALKDAGIARVDCAAVHGIFADDCDKKLILAGLRQLITSNSIPHPSNEVDLSSLLVKPIKKLMTPGF